MGMQRRIAGDLMEQFKLSERDAYEIVQFMEPFVAIGDHISACMSPIYDEGDVEESLRELRAVRDTLSRHIESLSAAFSGIEKRKES
jgi:hypothetical protein